jgi:hypothetical protein
MRTKLALTYNPNQACPALPAGYGSSYASYNPTTNPNNRVVALVWHQGEQDLAMTATTYGGYLSTMISNFRTAIGNSTCPFVCGGLSPTTYPSPLGPETYQSTTLINTISYTGFASSRTPTALPTQVNPGDPSYVSGTNGVHFRTTAYRQFAARYWAAYIGALTNNLLVSPTLTGPLTTSVSAYDVTNNAYEITIGYTSTLATSYTVSYGTTYSATGAGYVAASTGALTTNPTNPIVVSGQTSSSSLQVEIKAPSTAASYYFSARSSK